jgi:peptide/nickel transport system permease protein
MTELEIADVPVVATRSGLPRRLSPRPRRSSHRGSVMTVAAMVWLGLIVVLAIIAGWLPVPSAIRQVGASRVAPFGHWTWGLVLGTDDLGRSELSRFLFGARQSLEISVLAAVIGMTVGGLIGLVSGYRGGWLQTVTDVFSNALLAFPAVVFLLALGTIYRPTAGLLIIGLAIIAVPSYIRISRANTIRFANREFVQAAVALGARSRRILFREILPNVVPSVIPFAVVQIGILMIAEASLSYLGVGIPPPTPSWGGMIADGQTNLAQASFLVFVPAVGLFLTVYSLNVLGDWVRQRFDVTQSRL